MSDQAIEKKYDVIEPNTLVLANYTYSIYQERILLYLLAKLKEDMQRNINVIENSKKLVIKNPDGTPSKSALCQRQYFRKKTIRLYYAKLQELVPKTIHRGKLITEIEDMATIALKFHKPHNRGRIIMPLFAKTETKNNKGVAEITINEECSKYG